MAVSADNFRKMEAHLFQSAEIKRQTAANCAGSIAKAADVIVEAFPSGGKLLLCGNGGRQRGRLPGLDYRYIFFDRLWQ
jgi:N-acetylmuramic acid 6-phosphate (MurNAc-6-P) etherase